MMVKKQHSWHDVELSWLCSLQAVELPHLDWLAHAIHLIIRDDVLLFFAPTALFALESPTFGLTLLITLCLSEVVNGILKLYCIRPRPLWVSSALRRKGSAWEKDSSFPSSHSQFVASVFASFLLDGHHGFPVSTRKVLLYAMGLFTFLTGFSRVYLAMHFVSDVVAGWLFGFLVALFVHKTSFILTLARLPMTHSLGISIFSTIYILGVLILSSDSGKASLKPGKIQKWLKTAQSSIASKDRAPSVQDKGNPELIQPHDAVKYQMPLGVYFGATVAASILPHVLHPSIPMPAVPSLPQYHPYSHYSQAPPFSRLLVGIGSILILETLKSIAFKRKKRLLWPVWIQIAFALSFYFVAGAWGVLGTEMVYIWGWPLEAAVSDDLRFSIRS